MTTSWSRGAPISLTFFRISSLTVFVGMTLFGLPISSLSCSCISSMGCIASCPKKIASIISDSETKRLPLSTIVIPERLHATIRLISLSTCSLSVGLAINLPSTLPTRTPAIGPAKGISDISSAVEAPSMANTSASFSLSVESTVAITCVS